MVSSKKIKSLKRRYKTAFDALEEFESTGRIILKKRMNFTIDRNISKEFRDYCFRKGLNMSSEVENMMKEKLR